MDINPARAGAQRTEFFGLYRGSVTDNNDPERRGRLKVLVPQVLGMSEVWAMPCVPYAGPQRGLYLMPEIGTGLWLQFEAGDPSFPVWVGMFWNEGDIAEADAAPTVKYLKTTKFTVRIDDDEGEMIVEDDQGSKITINAQEVSIVSQAVKTEAGGGKKTELSSSSFTVNDGALEVL